jgi:ankyrin repeat protein
MIKKLKDFINSHTLKYEQDIPKTQEELSTYLLTAIRDNSYESFVDAIKRGADVNFIKGANITPLLMCIYGDKIEMVKYLINAGADFFDYYDYMKKLLNEKDFKDVLKVILKKYPNFEEEIKMRKDAKKYNL